MVEFNEQTVHCLANSFRQTEIQRVGGKEFALRILKLDRTINALCEEEARNLAFKMLHNQSQPERKGYLLAWFDGMGYGGYTYYQVVENIGVREYCLDEVELLALW
jgi:GGDEF domain-containing protein